MSQMFVAQKFVTSGIAAEIGLDIQLYLWAMIDFRKRKGIQLDYLQVFVLLISSKDGTDVQKVVHKQECPPVTDIYYLPMLETPVTATIWAIDNEEYCTMLFPEEY